MHCLELSNKAHYPEGLIGPILPKPLSVLAAIVSGVIKTVLFPITTLFLTLGFAIKGIYEWASDRSGKDYAVAALLNFAGCAASIAFLGAIAFFLPFELSCALMITAVSVSIVFHVVKAL